jgi:hypothetical protein
MVLTEQGRVRDAIDENHSAHIYRRFRTTLG